jgi:hypothetical protein
MVLAELSAGDGLVPWKAQMYFDPKPMGHWENKNDKVTSP